MGEGEQGSSEADGEGGDVMDEVEKERGEQGSKVKQGEMDLMGVRGWGGGSSDHMMLGSKCQ